MEAVVWNINGPPTWLDCRPRYDRRLVVCSSIGALERAAIKSTLSSDTKKCYAEALRRCGNTNNLWEGQRLHFLLKSRGYDGDVFLGNLLVQMYGKCGQLEAARASFDRLVWKNVFSWTILILAYFQNGHYTHALQVYEEMRKDARNVQPDDFIFSVALSACGALGTDGLEDGKKIHRDIAGGDDPLGSFRIESKIVSTGLLDMYAKCGSVEDARKVFDKMEHKDIVAWGAMITGYSEKGDGQSTLEMFRRMEQDGTRPNMYTYSGVLDACSRLGAVAEGQSFHARVIDVGLETDLVVATAVVTMYSRCGRMREARVAFKKVKIKDVVCWNSLLAGYSQHGHRDETVELFQEMAVDSWKIDRVTFNSMLHACSHTGLVEQGRNHFVSMSMDFGIPPDIDHFSRFVDILGRAGWLEQAQELVDRMPFEPSSVIWLTLLGSFKLHGRVERAEHAADRILQLEPDNTAAFLLVSNIYAKVGRWEDVRRIKQAMQERGRKKQPGQSYIEVKNRLHEFGPKTKIRARVRRELERLEQEMKEAGYVQEVNEELRDIETMEEDVEVLGYHSERVALAFGLVSAPACAPLHIVKNLRVCSECHGAIKIISKIVNRTVTLRDANCYHRFEQGQCSCKDHW